MSESPWAVYGDDEDGWFVYHVASSRPITPLFIERENALAYLGALMFALRNLR